MPWFESVNSSQEKPIETEQYNEKKRINKIKEAKFVQHPPIFKRLKITNDNDLLILKALSLYLSKKNGIMDIDGQQIKKDIYKNEFQRKMIIILTKKLD